MADRMPMLPALRAFEAVARLGSVRAAAAELHVTPAAVSQQVKALEADLGRPLTRRRSGRQASPARRPLARSRQWRGPAPSTP